MRAARRSPPTLFADPLRGVWRRRQDQVTDALVCGPRRWTLYRYGQGYGVRRAAFAYLDHTSALELLLAWGFAPDAIWQADDYWQTKSGRSAPKSLNLHTPTHGPDLDMGGAGR